MGPELAQAIVGFNKIGKAAKGIGNQIKGITKTVHKFDERKNKPSHFKKKININ